MSYRSSALLKNVKDSEHEGLLENEDLLSRVSAAEIVLENFYKTRCPKSQDSAYRRDLISRFNQIAREIYGTRNYPVVEEFGSFVMKMFTSESDLDLSVNLSHDAAGLTKDEKINILTRFANKLYFLRRMGEFKDVESIFSARVPIVKVTDCRTGIECDLSVENRDGIAKSRIIFMITTIDERFLRLSFMLKAWAKFQGINSSRDRTFNSFSLILLAAFHLQCQDPPILPPFSSILKDGFDLSDVQRNVDRFLNYGQRNRDSVVKLFTTLLIRLNSLRHLWRSGLCASVVKGSWTYKYNRYNWNICIEDFMDRSQNVARSVGTLEATIVYERINNSLRLIRSFINGKVRGDELRRTLFGPDNCRSEVTLMSTRFNNLMLS